MDAIQFLQTVQISRRPVSHDNESQLLIGVFGQHINPNVTQKIDVFFRGDAADVKYDPSILRNTELRPDCPISMSRVKPRDIRAGLQTAYLFRRELKFFDERVSLFG